MQNQVGPAVSVLTNPDDSLFTSRRNITTTYNLPSIIDGAMADLKQPPPEQRPSFKPEKRRHDHDGEDDGTKLPKKKQRGIRGGRHRGKCLHCDQEDHQWARCWQICVWCGTRDHGATYLQPAAKCPTLLVLRPKIYERHMFNPSSSQIEATSREEMPEQPRHEVVPPNRATPHQCMSRAHRHLDHNPRNSDFSIRGAATRQHQQPYLSSNRSTHTSSAASDYSYSGGHGSTRSGPDDTTYYQPFGPRSRKY